MLSFRAFRALASRRKEYMSVSPEALPRLLKQKDYHDVVGIVVGNRLTNFHSKMLTTKDKEEAETLRIQVKTLSEVLAAFGCADCLDK